MRKSLGTILSVPISHWVKPGPRQHSDDRALWEAAFESLHTAFAHLLEEPDSSAPFDHLLARIKDQVDASAGFIFTLPEPGAPLTLWITTPGADTSCLCGFLDGRFPLFGGNDCKPICLPLDEEGVPGTVVVVSLSHGRDRLGVLVLKMPRSPHEVSRHIPLLEKLGAGTATMISGARRARINRSKALREERSAIARDLHDSLAQSLSYGKIQVSRLQSLLQGERHNVSPWCGVEMDSIVQELRGNLNMAYRQLRELITTCRLTMDGRSLDQALEDSVDEFDKRSGIVFALDNRVVGASLKADEEMQILHIVREALSNIVRHSHAKHALVRLSHTSDGALKIVISDDGTGMALNSNTCDRHHGLMIMQERTRRLGGDFSLGSNADGGTYVHIRFRPRKEADGQVADARIHYDDILPTDRIDHR